MQTKTMKPAIAAIAMLLLLTLTMVGVKSMDQCVQQERANVPAMEKQNNAIFLPYVASPAC